MKRFGNALKLTAVLAVSLLALVALAGCGDKKDSGNGNGKSYEQDKPLGEAKKVVVKSDKEFDADQQAVIDKIAEFADMTQKHDYKGICKEIFSKEAQKIGGDCVGTLEKTGSTIKDFKITVSSVAVGKDGKTATAKATTIVNGQAGGEQSLTLAKDSKGDWRVTILGN
ncbi:MAG: hypothetical protein HY827_08590 [Actinobacteria bacterium]|nr:hypothetical protein [Actinomycetota bacterium]